MGRWKTPAAVSNAHGTQQRKTKQLTLGFTLAINKNYGAKG